MQVPSKQDIQVLAATGCNAGRSTISLQLYLSLLCWAFRPLLKSWRKRRRLSPLDLALDAGMSQRPLRFLETGRWQPSRYAIRQFFEAFEMPAAEPDVMLMSAGFTPQSANGSWKADVRDAVNASIDHVLNGHEPFPAVSVDRILNLQRANDSA